MDRKFRALWFCAVLVLAGCAERPGPESLNPQRPVAGAETIAIFAATDRAPGTGAGYGSGRARTSFERIDLQKQGQGGGGQDDYIAIGRAPMDARAFLGEIATRPGTVAVFVHGYNFSYQEAVFRLARLGGEFRDEAVPVLFSWPSEASVSGYVADRDAATYARDDLAALLTALRTQLPDRPVLLVGHSMGGWLVMEALRQLRLEGRDNVIDGLEVALAAPDIDLDLFRVQAARVGPLDPPLTVLVSPDDRALAVSASAAAGRPRLGAVNVTDPPIQKFAAQLGMRVVDISTLPASSVANHDRFVALGAQYYGGSSGLDVLAQARQAGVYLIDTTGRVLSGGSITQILGMP